MKLGRSNCYLWGVFLGGLVGIVGCGGGVPATPVVAGKAVPGSTVDQVCTITAKLLGVARSEITPETTLGELKADELDFVELVMDLEEHFVIMIPDDVAAGMGGNVPWQEGMKTVTMAKLAAVVDRQKQMPGAGSPPAAPQQK